MQSQRLKAHPPERHLLAPLAVRSTYIDSRARQLHVVSPLTWMPRVSILLLLFQTITSSCFTPVPVPALAQMAQAHSKEAFFTPLRMMASFHWRTLIAEGFLPTIPRWRALITDLNFWQRLVSKSLCRFVQPPHDGYMSPPNSAEGCFGSGLRGATRPERHPSGREPSLTRFGSHEKHVTPTIEEKISRAHATCASSLPFRQSSHSPQKSDG